MDWTDEINSNVRSLMRSTKNLDLSRQIGEILNGVDLSDVAYTWYYRQLTGRVFVRLTLAEDKRDSHLVHKLSQHLGIEFTKSKSLSGESLDYRGESDSLILVVGGAVPATCEVRVIEEELTPEEIEQARAAVPTTRVRREIVCGKVGKELAESVAE